jgi:hypothetical protein
MSDAEASRTPWVATHPLAQQQFERQRLVLAVDKQSQGRPDGGITERVHAVALAAYDRIIGLQLADIPTDACITKTPCDGDKAGPSPADRRKGGLKRSVATEGAGQPLSPGLPPMHWRSSATWYPTCTPRARLIDRHAGVGDRRARRSPPAWLRLAHRGHIAVLEAVV